MCPHAAVEEKLLRYLQDLLKRDEAEGSASRNVISNVRALALAALADRGKISRADLERHSKHLPEMSLFGKAAFLEAVSKVPETGQMRQEVLRDILSHADRSSGTIRFTEAADSALGFILASPVRDNAAILMAFLCCQPSAASPELGDIPVLLMKTIAMSRKGRDCWASTQENLYASMAMLRFSKTYESSNAAMGFEALLDQQSLGKGRFESVTDKPVRFDYSVPDSDLGRKAVVGMRKEGEGRLYYEVDLSYTPAQLPADSVNAGIEIHREYSIEREGKWELLKNPLEVKTGEVVRVDLFVSLPSERYFVVVEDPVPGGFEPVNRELATTSEVDAQKGESPIPADSFLNRYTDWRSFGISRWSFYHKELRHHAARFYSERLAAGHYHLSYTAQAIAPGSFTALPARAEEMYNPDVFGKSTPAILQVQLAE